MTSWPACSLNLMQASTTGANCSIADCTLCWQHAHQGQRRVMLQSRKDLLAVHELAREKELIVAFELQHVQVPGLKQ